MIIFDTTIIFIASSVALALVPGPDNIFVLMQSALYGRKAGLVVTLGLCSGLLVHTAIVALGIATIFQTSPLAFNLLKISGGIYLLYLAVLAFKSSSSKINSHGSRLSYYKLYSRGIIMNITNPKVAIFFLAFLPQFTNINLGLISIQILLLGCLFILSTLLVFSFIAINGGYLQQWLQQSPSAPIILNTIAGIIFVALAIRLFIS